MKRKNLENMVVLKDVYQEKIKTLIKMQKMWIEKWNGQLPSTMTDDAGILIEK